MAIGTFLLDNGSTGNTTVHIGGRLRGERILVPIVSNDPEAIQNRISIASTIATATDGVLRVVRVETEKEDLQRTISPRTNPDELNDVISWATEQTSKARDQWHSGILNGRKLEREIRHRVDTNAWDTLVLPAQERNGYVTGHHQRRLYEAPPCSVLTVNGDAGFGDCASILVPIANGPHSGLATDVASALVHQWGAYVDILHVVDPDADESARKAAERRVETGANRIGQDDRTSTWLLEAVDPAAEIIEQSRYYGLTIIGAPQSSRLHRFVYGSVSDSVTKEADSAVLSVSAETRP